MRDDLSELYRRWWDERWRGEMDSKTVILVLIIQKQGATVSGLTPLSPLKGTS